MEDKKETFINILSHDLKTPLLAQVHMLKMLIDGKFGKLTPEQQEILRLTSESCAELLGMVSDVLTNYKIESNEISFNFETVNMQKIIEEACIEADEQLKHKALCVEIFPSFEDVRVDADVLFLKKAIINILENCITYADKNTLMSIKLHNTARNICVSVSVRGKQLSQDVLESLFDYNSRKSLTHTKIGFGMKLNLALNIIKAHSGGIVARNGAQNEVIFEVILPICNSGAFAVDYNTNIKIA